LRCALQVCSSYATRDEDGNGDARLPNKVKREESILSKEFTSMGAQDCFFPFMLRIVVLLAIAPGIAICCGRFLHGTWSWGTWYGIWYLGFCVLLEMVSDWLGLTIPYCVLPDTVQSLLVTSISLLTFGAMMYIVFSKLLGRQRDVRCTLIPFACAALATVLWNLLAPTAQH